MENENTSFANILIPFLRSCSEHSVQHNEASGNTFYKEVGCPN